MCLFNELQGLTKQTNSPKELEEEWIRHTYDEIVETLKKVASNGLDYYIYYPSLNHPLSYASGKDLDNFNYYINKMGFDREHVRTCIQSSGSANRVVYIEFNW